MYHCNALSNINKRYFVRVNASAHEGCVSFRSLCPESVYHQHSLTHFSVATEKRILRPNVHTIHPEFYVMLVIFNTI